MPGEPPRIVGLGYSGLDRVCLVPEVPQDGKVEIREELAQGGGPAATATVAAARLGAATAFVGVVGDDDAGKAILDEFAAEGVETRAIQRRTGAVSAHAYCWAEIGSSRRSIAWTRGTSLALTVDEVPVQMLSTARALLLDGHQGEAAVRAAKLVRAAGGAVLLDAGSPLPVVGQLLALSTVVIASREFASRRLGTTETAALARGLAAMVGPGARSLVTLGSEGCVWAEGNQVRHVPAFAVEVVDTTGAGDVFHGAFAVGLAEGWAWERIVPFASAVAALKCRRLGGRAGIPSRPETLAFLRRQGC